MLNALDPSVDGRPANGSVLMDVLAKVLGVTIDARRLLMSRWRLARLRVYEAPFHRCYKVGVGTAINVPVRGGGLGTVDIGKRNAFGYRSGPRFGNGEILIQARTPGSRIVIGDDNAFSNNISIISCGEVRIGNLCQIGDLVAIYDCDFHAVDPRTRHRTVGKVDAVTIGNNVWLGSRVMVLKGVTIGDNSVVAAMSVVSRSLPPNVLAAGIPARVLRQI